MLRNYRLIKSKLPNTLDLKEVQETILHINSIAIMRAEPEFYDKFNVKKIDWDSKETKITISLPNWRKVNPDEPPTESRNFYAKDIPNVVREDMSIRAISSHFKKHTDSLKMDNGRIIGLNPFTIQRNHSHNNNHALKKKKNGNPSQNQNKKKPTYKNSKNTHSSKGNNQNRPVLFSYNKPSSSTGVPNTPFTSVLRD